LQAICVSAGAIEDMTTCNRSFYSGPPIAKRMARSVCRGRSPLFGLIRSLSSHRNSRLPARAHADFERDQEDRFLETPGMPAGSR